MKQFTVTAEGYFLERDCFGLWGWFWKRNLQFPIQADNEEAACKKFHYSYDKHLRFRNLKVLKVEEK